MKGTGEPILYLDFDGVLHHENCYWHPRKGAYLKAPPGYRLFQHVGLLESALAPFPDVRIVLSTSWQLQYGYTGCTKRLPTGLRERCIGGTYHSNHMHGPTFVSQPRGVQVSRDVERRRPSAWVALDDAPEGWPAEANWIQTDPTEGLAGAGVLGRLQEALWGMCRGEGV